LERCAGDEQSSTRDEGANDLREDRIDILDSMGFVDDDILERKFLQSSLFDQAHFVRSNTDFEILRNEPASNNFRAFFFGAGQSDNVEIRGPLLEFTMPVLEGRLGDDNEVRPRDIPVVFKVS
jgi:hypothetical protein